VVIIAEASAADDRQQASASRQLPSTAASNSRFNNRTINAIQITVLGESSWNVDRPTALSADGADHLYLHWLWGGGTGQTTTRRPLTSSRGLLARNPELQELNKKEILALIALTSTVMKLASLPRV
jgi:hypothetical protein